MAAFRALESMGRYPLKAKFWPFRPLAIKAKIIEEGPTNGTTLIFFSCAIRTISDPGSAMAGHPASDRIPTSCPSKHGFKKEWNSAGSVNLLRTFSFRSAWDFLGLIFLINRLADFSFSTMQGNCSRLR